MAEQSNHKPDFVQSRFVSVIEFMLWCGLRELDSADPFCEKGLQ